MKSWEIVLSYYVILGSTIITAIIIILFVWCVFLSARLFCRQFLLLFSLAFKGIRHERFLSILIMQTVLFGRIVVSVHTSLNTFKYIFFFGMHFLNILIMSHHYLCSICCCIILFYTVMKSYFEKKLNSNHICNTAESWLSGHWWSLY